MSGPWRWLIAGSVYLAIGLMIGIGFRAYDREYPTSIEASIGLVITSALLWPIALALDIGWWSAKQADERAAIEARRSG